MAATQTVQLSSAHAAAVRAAVERLKAERYIARLWDRDASLWATDAATQASIRARLGWLTIAGVMSRQAEALRGFAQEIREAGLTRAVLLGMGGSGLFAEVCRRTFGVAANALDLTVLDTTDPTAIRDQQDRGPLTQLLVIVSSKSGSTSEISALSAYFIEALTQAGCDAGTHCIAITDEGTPLDAQATTARFRRLFAHGRGTGAEVGGRFSALTYFGLVPAALMGIDPAPLLRRAEEMLAWCGPATPLDDNPAVQLGAVLGALSQAGRDKVTLLAAPA
ncbi:MAG: transaldolase, partial [Dehalococcoidia bacterium]|nr:transaldolase [Dehalococcoidia bacterium]